MSTIQNLFQQAQLAEAAYADFSDPNVTAKQALQNEGFSETQATIFLENWREINQSPPLGFFGNGFSATLFERLGANQQPTGQYTLSIAGSLPGVDWANDLDLATGGVAYFQVQEMVNYVLRLQAGSTGTTRQVELLTGATAPSLTSTLVSGIGPGISPDQLTITGHSLGGFLGQVFQRIFGSAGVYTYNALGVVRPDAPIFDQLTDLLGLPSGSYSSGPGENLLVPGEPAQLIGTVQGKPQIQIFTETESATINPIDTIPAHKMGPVADSLALYNLFATLDPSLNTTNPADGIGKITGILKAASNVANQSLEATLDALRTLFEQNYTGSNSNQTALPTATDERESLYTHLDTLKTWLTNSPFTSFSIESLADKSAATLFAQSQVNTSDGLAYRYALYTGNAFVVKGASALYDAINSDSALSLYDPATHTGNLTQVYLADRSNYLAKLFTRNTQDNTDTIFSSTGGDMLYRDYRNSQITEIRTGSAFTGNDARRHIVFGSAQSDTLLGGSVTDHLYGMDGNDTINGGDGADILEGNTGDDLLYGGFGNDTLVGGMGFDTYRTFANEGFDTIEDTDGRGKLIVGSLEINGSTGIDPTKWIHTTGTDTWTDQTNAITYSKTVVNGETQLLVHKGDSNILVKSWADGELGITLGTGTTPVVTQPVATLTGDFKKAIDTHGTPDTGDDTYIMTAGNYTADGGEANALDLISGTAGDDAIDGLGGDDALSGMAGDDHIEGGSGGDSIQGGLGKDTINGGAGDDAIYGSSDMVIDKPTSVNFVPPANNYLYPQATGFNWTTGYNTTFANGVPDSYSNASRNRLDGDQGNLIDGGAGNDFIAAGTGADTVHGGADKDWIWGMDQDDVLFGDGDNDLIYGDGTQPGGNSVVWALPENHGHDIIDGGDGDDYLFGQGKDDIILGGLGNDIMWGDDQNAAELDPAYHGNDYLDGGDGKDQIVGGGKDDTLMGGDGNDTLWGDDDAANLPEQYHGNDVLYGGAGADQLVGGAGNDILDGGAGVDELYGGAGNDTYLNVTGDDVISDTEGHDTIVLAAATGLGAGGLSVVNTGDQGQYRQLNIALDTGETLKLDDAFFGSSAAIQFANGDELDLETLVGARLATSLYLGLDNNGGRLYGGAAADILNGGSGDDMLAGHLGNDTLQGGYGNDVYLVSRGDGQEIIFEEGGDADILRFGESIRPEDIKPIRWYGWDYWGNVEDSLRLEWLNTDGPSPKTEYVHIKNYFQSVDDSRRVDRIEFSNGGAVWTYADIQALLLAPTNGQDTLQGFAGVDVIDGLDGHDSINGKTGDDVLNGGSGDDDLQGGLGNDTLLGGAGNDRLLGYSAWLNDTSAARNDPGVDVLYGGTGNDLMFGGQGNDTYLFGRGDGYDEIGEVPNASGPGTDVLRLRAGVLPEHVTLYRVLSPGSGDTDGDLLVVLDGSPTQILIRGYFSSEDRQIERIEFDGGAGAVWMAADINALVVAGTQNSMVGTSADDVFVVDHEFDSISEPLNGGTDTIIASRTFWQLPANVENLALTGFLNIGAYGNGLNNILKGNSGNNFIIGNGGFDIVYGGPGDDVYRDVDQIIELDGEGIDTLLSIGGTLPDNVENMYMGKYGQQAMLSGYGAYDLATIYPSGNYGIAIGNGLDNILVSPGVGNQNQQAPYVLDGRAGADTMVVHAADKVVVYIDNAADRILGTPYEIRSSIDYILPEDAAIPVYSFGNFAGNAASSTATACLVLVGSDAVNGVGNTLNNMLDGMENTAINTLIGGKGNDYYRLGMDDVAVELANEGFDTVEIYSATNASTPSIFYDMAGKNIEKVILTGYQPGTVIGSLLDDYIVGNDANNDLQGDAGNDTLEGRGGTDTLTGGDGDDLYYADASDVIVENVSGGYDTTIFSFNPYGSFLHNVMAENVEEARSNGSAVNIIGNSAANRIVGDSWNNRLSGGDGSDILNGGYGNDTLIGDSGNDRLDGGDGIDGMAGGVGDDVYVVDNAGDTVTENVDEGRDGVESIITYTLGTNVEMLTLAGAAAIDGTGNNLANVLIGNGLANVLDGGLDADTMTGGLGNDTYVVDNVDDVVNETSTLATEIDTIQSSISYTLGSNVENLTLIGTASIDGSGNELANVLRGNSGYNLLYGLDGNDTIYAGDGDEAYGGVGNDTLIAETSATEWAFLSGGDGDDVLNGGEGPTDLVGGLGNDILIGGNAAYNYLWGDDFGATTGGNDLILGGTSIDYAWGGYGDDTISGNDGNDTLIGNQGNDLIYGGAGSDTLTGGLDIDTLVGGTGDDTYNIDNVADIVTENAGEGIDTVRTTVSRILDVNVENLTLTGTAAINGTGNELNNVLTGNGVNNTLTGGAGDDILKGGATGIPVSTTLGSLVIYARGTPVLDVYPTMQVYVDGVLIQEFTVDAASYTAYTIDPARLGMAAGKVDVVFTNDAYRPDIGQDRNLYVQKIEVNGQVMNATDNGVFYDPGKGAAAFDGINLRLGQETLGSNGAMRFSLEDNDILDGGSGADQMFGGGGNDTYLVDNVGDVLTEMPNEGVDTVRSSIGYALGENLENLVLTGSAAINGTGNTLINLLMGNGGNNILYGDAGADTLIGNAGNDRLDGGAGNDILQGGQGNDTYVVESAGDSVSESANQGWDTVESSISYILGANVENLTLTGAAAINGTGNDLDNYLLGNSANNVLTGGAGNDTLDGGAGADAMIGGAGDDYYVVDNAGDIVTENAGEGTYDSVDLYLNADYTLGDEIEYFYRYGSGNWTTTGNASVNYLYGNSGSDTLIGLAGDDLLWGGAGADTLIGGVGNDKYYVNSVGDIVTEATGEGADTVYVFGSLAYTLAANVENGYRTFWEGNLTGNELDNSLSGSWGVDTLDGGGGADTLSGWGGDDTLMGGLGSDTYMMGRGYGIDTVVENDATPGNTDVVSFMSGTSADQIWFQQVGNNLEASIIGTTDKLVINDWYLGSDHHVEQFQTTDGAQSLLDSNVQNLVNAMASFAPPAAGQTTLPTDYQASLAPVIAANWQ